MKKYIYTISLLLISICISGCANHSLSLQQNETLSAGVSLKDAKIYVRKGKVNNTDSTGSTALEYAATSPQNINIMQYLIDNGADVNFTKSNLTALGMAVIIGNYEAVKLLINNGAIYKKKSEYENSLLYQAITSGHLKIVKYLISKGLSLEKEGSKKKLIGDINIHLKTFEGLKDKSVNTFTRNIYKENVVKLKATRTFIENYYGKEKIKQQENQQKEQIKQKKIIKDDIQKNVNSYIKKNDLKGLKTYTEENPSAVYYIKDKTIRLMLTGPKGMKVGDIRKLIKDKRSDYIIISLIKRVKSPYKEFTLEEIDLLLKMKLSDKIISAMMDVTTKLLEKEDKKQQQQFLLNEQKRIKNQEVKVQVKEKVIYRNNPNQKVDTQGNPIVERVQGEIIKKGIGMLFDSLF